MRIHHIALRTRDVPALRAFYTDLLGLATFEGRPKDSIWLDAGGTILMIEPATDGEPDVPAGTRELVAFAASREDCARLEAALASRGVAVEARTAFTIYFRDPDGRRVGLSHYPD